MDQTLAARENKSTVLWHQIVGVNRIYRGLRDLIDAVSGGMSKDVSAKTPEPSMPQLSQILMEGPERLRNNVEECLKSIEELKEMLI